MCWNEFVMPHSDFSQPKAKKQKLDDSRQPLSILTWNVNGLLSVVADSASKKPAQELRAFIKRPDSPSSPVCRVR